MEKPYLTTDQLIAIMNRIDRGQEGILEKVKAHFTLTKGEENFIEAYIRFKPFRK